jgi:hypothetical protein
MSSHRSHRQLPLARRQSDSQRLSHLLERAHYTNYEWSCQQYNHPYGVVLHQAAFYFDGVVISISNWQTSRTRARGEAATAALPIVRDRLRGLLGGMAAR